jgi:hypothetical protein
MENTNYLNMKRPRSNSKAYPLWQAAQEAERLRPKTSTSWSSPTRNIFKALNLLRRALNSGHNAKLERRWNAECDFPIKETVDNRDISKYEFAYGTVSTKDEIMASTTMSEFEKYLTLNYHNCYGTREAVDNYQKTGVLTADNLKGMGVGHLVKVKDMVEFIEANDHESGGDMDRARMFKEQYITGEQANNRHFWDFYRLRNGWNDRKNVEFKHKLWVVVLYYNYPKVRTPFAVHVLNVLAWPLKFWPERRVLRMPEYTNYTFRIGSVVHGFAVEFQIPKKFSFKN